MSKVWVWVIIIIVILGLSYLYRHQIEGMLGMSYTSPVSTSYFAPAASPSSAPVGPILGWMGTTPSQYAVGSNGMTLYTFSKDTKGVSNCTGSCAGLWPPYTSSVASPALPVNVTLVKRADGTMQFAYKGMPLYYYSGDTKAGDTMGNGVGGFWSLVKP